MGDLPNQVDRFHCTASVVHDLFPYQPIALPLIPAQLSGFTGDNDYTFDLPGSKLSLILYLTILSLSSVLRSFTNFFKCANILRVSGKVRKGKVSSL